MRPTSQFGLVNGTGPRVGDGRLLLGLSLARYYISREHSPVEQDGHAFFSTIPTKMLIRTETWSFAPLDVMDCVVCLDKKDASEFPDTPLTSECTHGQSVCIDCVRFTIRTELKSRLWSEIECPDCDGKLSYEAVQRYADEETRQRYTELSIRGVLQLDDDFIWVSSLSSHWELYRQLTDVSVCLGLWKWPDP